MEIKEIKYIVEKNTNSKVNAEWSVKHPNGTTLCYCESKDFALAIKVAVEEFLKTCVT